MTSFFPANLKQEGQIGATQGAADGKNTRKEGKSVHDFKDDILCFDTQVSD
jgi:hypothetical protein